LDCVVVSGTIWVAELNISHATAVKISAKHDLETFDVRKAIVCVPGLQFTWHDHPDRGLRAILRVPIRGVDRLIVLYPVPSPFGDVWNLGSVY
jgi:hypothetical protein